MVSAIFNRCRLKSDAVFQYAGAQYNGRGYYMIPLEQRQAERVKTRKAGRIVLTNGSEIRRMIRNLLRSGACLEVGSHFGIPRDILLEIKANTSNGRVGSLGEATSNSGFFSVRPPPLAVQNQLPDRTPDRTRRRSADEAVCPSVAVHEFGVGTSRHFAVHGNLVAFRAKRTWRDLLLVASRSRMTLNRHSRGIADSGQLHHSLPVLCQSSHKVFVMIKRARFVTVNDKMQQNYQFHAQSPWGAILIPSFNRS